MIKNKLVPSVIFFVITIFLLSGCTLSSEELDSTKNPDNVTQRDNTSNDSDLSAENNSEKEESQNGASPTQSGITVNSIPFTLIASGMIDSATLDKSIQSEIEMLKFQKGFSYWKTNEGEYLIFITSGEKNTGGYGIKVISVEDNEGKTVIMVEEISPDKDAMVTMALTYPFAVIKVTGVTENFVIKNQDNEEFSLINLENGIIRDAGTSSGADTMLSYDESRIDFSKPIRAIYQGQIDGNSVEVLLMDQYLALRTQEVNDQINGLETGDLVEVVVEISPYDQLIAKRITKIEN